MISRLTIPVACDDDWHMMIVNDNSSVIITWSFKIIDAARGVIYDRHMFIVQPICVLFQASRWPHGFSVVSLVVAAQLRPDESPVRGLPRRRQDQQRQRVRQLSAG